MVAQDLSFAKKWGTEPREKFEARVEMLEYGVA